MTVVPAVVVMILFHSPSAAYGATDDPPGPPSQARSLPDLRDWVRLGDRVRVVDSSGRQLQGTLAGISVDDQEITLRIDGGSVLTIPEDVLERIDLEVADPLGNGALIGLGTGVGAAAMMSLGCNGGEFVECLVWSSLLCAPIGLAVGVGVDALVTERRLVYAAPRRRPRLRIDAVPTISPRRKGMSLILSW
jgi:hypothetical protein